MVVSGKTINKKFVSCVYKDILTKKIILFRKDGEVCFKYGEEIRKVKTAPCGIKYKEFIERLCL